MTNTSLFGTHFEKGWFNDQLKVREFFSALCDEFPGEEFVNRPQFNTWLTEVTNFCLPVDVALLANELVCRGCIAPESFGGHTNRYKINHETIRAFMNNDQGNLSLVSEVKNHEVTKLVNDLDKLRVMLEALLQAYGSDYAHQRMSYVGMSKVALGSVGLARMRHDDVHTLANLLERRGFIKHFPIQFGSSGKIELLRDNVRMFIATGIIPWVSKQEALRCSHQPNQTQGEDVMDKTEEFEAEDLRVVVKVGGKCTTQIPRLAPAMIHTILKEAGFKRGVFNYQAQGFWAGFPATASTLHGKVMPSEGPAAFIGLKCGKNREDDTLSGHLSGAWAMKFTVVRQRLEAAIQRLNSSQWPGIITRPTGATTPVPPQPKPEASGTSPTESTGSVVAPATGTTSIPDETARLEELMMALIKESNSGGLLTTGEANNKMKLIYNERSAHGLFTSLFGKLRARGWLKRVDQEGKVMLQVGTPFLRSKGLPITFEELPEIQSSRSGDTRTSTSTRRQEASEDASSLPRSETNEGEPLPPAGATPPAKSTPGQVASVETSLKQLRNLMQRRDTLKTQLEEVTASINELFTSINREDLIALALEKL